VGARPCKNLTRSCRFRSEATATESARCSSGEPPRRSSSSCPTIVPARCASWRTPCSVAARGRTGGPCPWLSLPRHVRGPAAATSLLPSSGAIPCRHRVASTWAPEPHSQPERTRGVRCVALAGRGARVETTPPGSNFYKQVWGLPTPSRCSPHAERGELSPATAARSLHTVTAGSSPIHRGNCLDPSHLW